MAAPWYFILDTGNMEVWDDQQRQRAKALLGRPARAVLAAWILEQGGEEFFQSAATARLQADYGEASSALIQELQKFTRLGMLTRMESPGKVWYQQAPSPLWDIMRLAAAEFGLMSAADISERQG